MVCDREGDIFEDWATVPGRYVHMLTRLRMDRGVEGGGTVSQAIDDWAFVAIRDVELPSASEREKREAALSLRFGPISIRRPHAKGVGLLPETIALRLVEVVERDPPAGVEPIHWRLLTTRAVDDETMAWQIVDWYRRRWTIEQLFRLMKSDGLQLEDSELESADGRMKLTAIAARAACEVLQLVRARDGLPEPASIAFTPTEIAALDHINDEKQGATALQKNPHPRHALSWASWIITPPRRLERLPKIKPPRPHHHAKRTCILPNLRKRLEQPSCVHTVVPLREKGWG